MSQMTRVQALQSLCKRLPYQNLALRLKESEFDQIVEFAEEHEALGHLEFEYTLNKWLLDLPKPKHFGIMVELLMCANSSAKGTVR